MRRLCIIVLALTLFLGYAKASDITLSYSAKIDLPTPSAPKQIQPEKQLIQLFQEFGSQIRDISFNEVDKYVKSSGYKYERVVPTTSKFGSHKLFSNDGYALYFGYMPIDSSFDSQDFGNVHKEMLCFVELSCDGYYIAISNNNHTTEITYITFDEERFTPKMEVPSMRTLLYFFENQMGGNIPDEMPSFSLGASNSDLICSTIRMRSKEYIGCAIDDIIVNLVYAKEPEEYILLVYFEWEQNNKLDLIQEFITVYSDDLAAYVAQNHDSVSEIIVFWTIPQFYGENIVAKNSYSISNHIAYIVSRYGQIY